MGGSQGYLGAGLQPIRLPEHLTNGLGLGVTGGLMTVWRGSGCARRQGWVIDWRRGAGIERSIVDKPEAVRPLLADAVGKTIGARVLRGGALATLDIAVTERHGKD